MVRTVANGRDSSTCRAFGAQLPSLKKTILLYVYLYCFYASPLILLNYEKGKQNQAKHGVSFKFAQYAFIDPDRIIAEDLNHSQKEKRYYCFGKVGDGIITVRFTYRGSVIRIIGAGYWRKGRKIYESQN